MFQDIDWTDSESWIEIRVERMMDRADKKFMKKEITELEYQELVTNINQWSDKAYQFVEQFKTK
jgi:hypothetical protein